MVGITGHDTEDSTFDPDAITPPITFGHWGTSKNGAGVLGSSDRTTTLGAALSPLVGAGVLGVTSVPGGVGVRGQADLADGIAVLAVSRDGTALAAQSQTAGGALIEARLAPPGQAAAFRGP